jgi:hypothetical protein
MNRSISASSASRVTRRHLHGNGVDRKIWPLSQVREGRPGGKALYEAAVFSRELAVGVMRAGLITQPCDSLADRRECPTLSLLRVPQRHVEPASQIHEIEALISLA